MRSLKLPEKCSPERFSTFSWITFGRAGSDTPKWRAACKNLLRSSADSECNRATNPVAAERPWQAHYNDWKD